MVFPMLISKYFYILFLNSVSLVADELEHGMFDEEEPDEHASLIHKVKVQHVPMERQMSAMSHHSKSSHYEGTEDKEEASS